MKTFIFFKFAFQIYSVYIVSARMYMLGCKDIHVWVHIGSDDSFYFWIQSQYDIHCVDQIYLEFTEISLPMPPE